MLPGPVMGWVLGDQWDARVGEGGNVGEGGGRVRGALRNHMHGVQEGRTNQEIKRKDSTQNPAVAGSLEPGSAVQYMWLSGGHGE